MSFFLSPRRAIGGFVDRLTICRFCFGRKLVVVKYSISIDDTFHLKLVVLFPISWINECVMHWSIFWGYRCHRLFSGLMKRFACQRATSRRPPRHRYFFVHVWCFSGCMLLLFCYFLFVWCLHGSFRCMNTWWSCRFKMGSCSAESSRPPSFLMHRFPHTIMNEPFFCYLIACFLPI